MSTFCGIMREYPQVALDMFQGSAVLRARAYFLSHCHTGKNKLTNTKYDLHLFLLIILFGILILLSTNTIVKMAMSGLSSSK